MNKPIDNISLPDVPQQGDVTKYHGLAAAVGKLFLWARNLTSSMNKSLGQVQSQINSQVQMFGADLDSTSGTLVLTNANHHVTGAGEVDTITPPSGFSGPIFLVADGAFSLIAGGNISVAAGPFTVGQLVELSYDPDAMTWAPALGTGGGGGAPTNATYITETDETASLPNSFQLAAGSNITLTPVGNTLTVAATVPASGVTSVTGNSGIQANPTTGAVRLDAVPNVLMMMGA